MSVKSAARKFKRMPWWKRILTVALGGLTICGTVFGVVKLVDYAKDDYQTINPKFEVGNLGTDGKHLKDEMALYTKNSFKCDGLSIKLDFDHEISYKVYYYDDNDVFISSTEVYTEGNSFSAKGTTARLVIIPTAEDDDGKIDFWEKREYVNQMTVRRYKEQKQKTFMLGESRLMTVSDVSSLTFAPGQYSVSSNAIIKPSPTYGIITTEHLLSVERGMKFGIKNVSTQAGNKTCLTMIEFEDRDGQLIYKSSKVVESNGDPAHVSVSSGVDFVLFQCTVLNDAGGLLRFDELGISTVDFYKNIILY